MKKKLSELMAAAAGTGQAAAARAAKMGYPDALDCQRWPSFGYLRKFAGDDTGEAAIQALAAYCCAYHETVHGEQLYLKALELGIHDSAEAWGNLTVQDRLPYVTFAATARAVFDTLKSAVEIEPDAPPEPPKQELGIGGAGAPVSADARADAGGAADAEGHTAAKKRKT